VWWRASNNNHGQDRNNVPEEVMRVEGFASGGTTVIDRCRLTDGEPQFFPNGTGYYLDQYYGIGGLTGAPNVSSFDDWASAFEIVFDFGSGAFNQEHFRVCVLDIWD